MIIWRHGRTEWNATKRFQGQADIPLDDVGRHQAQLAAVALAALSPTKIVSSDLSRAQETARALAERTGLPIDLDRRLREIDVGSWQGLTSAEVTHGDPTVHDHRPGHDFRRSATGETAGEVAERVSRALTDIAESATDDDVVVVTMHGLAGRVGAARFVGVDPAHLGGLWNCAWINLERHRLGHWLIRAYNATADEVVLEASADRPA